MMNNQENQQQALFSIVYQGILDLFSDHTSQNVALDNFCSKLFEYQAHLTDESLGVPAGLSELQKTLEQCVDAKSAQGILVRAGRAAFHPYLVQFGEKFGWFETEFKLLSPRKRMLNGLESLAKNLYPRGGNDILLTSTENAWFWQDPGCPWCFGRESSGTSCTFTTGFLQEYAYWAGAGKTYLVREVECMANGGKACTYQIDKKPVE